MLRLVSYAWPGNVRELFQVVQRILIGATDARIDLRDIPEEIRASEQDEQVVIRSLAGVGLDKLEREAIRQTLAMTAGNREKTASLLGIGERTLYRKLKEYGIK
jgi:two-component system response regulator HydG